MDIITYPHRQLSAFDRFINSWFENSLSTTEERSIIPAVDVETTDKEYAITAEIPGIDKKDVHIEVNDGVLTISGEKSDKREKSDEHSYVCERRFGSFSRRFSLPKDADTDHINAQYANGVLALTIPRKQEKKNIKKINIQ